MADLPYFTQITADLYGVNSDPIVNRMGFSRCWPLWEDQVMPGWSSPFGSPPLVPDFGPDKGDKRKHTVFSISSDHPGSCYVPGLSAVTLPVYRDKGSWAQGNWRLCDADGNPTQYNWLTEVMGQEDLTGVSAWFARDAWDGDSLVLGSRWQDEVYAYYAGNPLADHQGWAFTASGHWGAAGAMPSISISWGHAGRYAPWRWKLNLNFSDLAYTTAQGHAAGVTDTFTSADLWYQEDGMEPLMVASYYPEGKAMLGFSDWATGKNTGWTVQILFQPLSELFVFTMNLKVWDQWIVDGRMTRFYPQTGKYREWMGCMSPGGGAMLGTKRMRMRCRWDPICYEDDATLTMKHPLLDADWLQSTTATLRPIAYHYFLRNPDTLADEPQTFVTGTWEGDVFDATKHRVKVDLHSDQQHLTPVVWGIAEYHSAELTTPSQDYVTLAGAVDLATIYYPATRRGLSCTLDMRGYQYLAGEPLYLDPNDLRGVKKLDLRAKRLGIDADFTQLFVGRLAQVAPRREAGEDAGRTRLQMTFKDRSWLWKGRRMLHFWSGIWHEMDLYDAVVLILANVGVAPTDIVFPEGYSGAWLLNVHDAVEPDTEVDALLDKLCARAGFMWWMGHDNKIYFDYQSTFFYGPKALSFTLDDETTTPLDRVEFVEAETDYEQMRNAVLVSADDKWNRDTSVAVYWIPSLNDPTSETYAGVPLWECKALGEQKGAQNANLPSLATRMLYRGLCEGRRVRWRSVGRPLFQWDLVQVDVQGLGVPAGTTFMVGEKTSRLALIDKDVVGWTDEYEGVTMVWPEGLIEEE
jgi:hypothetical protein